MASSIYAAWSVVAGEQPTTAKWNILGTNDGSFNTGLGFNDGILLPRHFSTSSFVITTTNGINYVIIGAVMFMWAQTVVANAGTAITFPRAFSATPVVTATVQDTNNQTAWVTAQSTTGTTLKQLYATNPLTVNWHAIGPA